MLTADYLKTKFEAGLNYNDYVKTGKEEQQKRWHDFEPNVHLTEAQKTLLSGFVRKMHVLVISGIWCGDCVQQCPMFSVIASANPEQIDLKFVDRDVHIDLSNQFKICAGLRVPTVLFLAEDFEFCGVMGDRTIHRYRNIARAKLGASCPIGIQPPEKSEIDDTLNDWVTEFERIQLMLRLSPRLRQLHND